MRCLRQRAGVFDKRRDSKQTLTDRNRQYNNSQAKTNTNFNHFRDHKNLNHDPWKQLMEKLLKQKLFRILYRIQKMVAKRPVFQ